MRKATSALLLFVLLWVPACSARPPSDPAGTGARSGTPPTEVPCLALEPEFTAGLELTAAETATIREACDRIAQIRRTTVTLTVTDAAGKPLPNLDVRIEQRRHRFAFGTQPLEMVQGVVRPAEQAAYDDKLFALFNQITQNFTWRRYEPTRGNARHDEAERWLQWARAHDAPVLGHQLIYTQNLPDWVVALRSPAEQAAAAEAHVNELVGRFRGRLQGWFVVNEAKNSASLAVMQRGRELSGPLPEAAVKAIADYVDPAFRQARASDPGALLMLNDNWILGGSERERNEAILQELKRRGTPLDAVGIQSHFRTEGRVPLDRVYAHLSQFAPYGRLYLSEVSVPARPQRAGENVFRAVPWSGWSEQTQAGYAVAAYTVAFSHPGVDGITYWSFTDRAMRDTITTDTGLLRNDLTPRPAYGALSRLIREAWMTRWEGRTDWEGRVRLPAFYGDYALSSTPPGGGPASIPFSVAREGEVVTLRVQ